MKKLIFFPAIRVYLICNFPFFGLFIEGIESKIYTLEIRYVSKSGKQPTTSTLAVLDTKSKHTANELRKMLHQILEDYDLPVSKTLAGITDNASNMVKLMVDFDKDGNKLFFSLEKFRCQAVYFFSKLCNVQRSATTYY